MFCLETIKSINNSPRQIRDNFNRDSSFVESKAGFVIHSGIHRSTAFIDRETCRDSHFAFTYWKEQGQLAINGYIEAVIDGASLEGCERNAFHATRKNWQVILPHGKGSQGNGNLTAILPGAFETRVGAATWRHLHDRTK